MNFCAQRLLSKLPKDIFVLESSHCRGVHKLSCLDKVGRSRPLPAAVNFKDFHFAPTVNLHTRSILPSTVHRVTCSETNSVLVFCQRYNASDKQTSGSSGEKKSLVEARESPYAHLTTGQKVKEAGKDATYIVVILAGIAVTGLMFYMIGKELFSSQSPSGVYGDALKKCQNHLEVAAALGEPIKGYGETTRRGRRRHVSHTEFDVNGVPHMRMRFYVEGPYKKATVHVEVQKDEGGKYQYRYLVVETEGYPHRTFVLEDNR